MTRNRVAMVAGLAVLAGAAGAADAQLISTHTYQGRLETMGEPALGVHQVRLRVYDMVSGGTLLATEIREKNFGTNDNGLFTFDDLAFGNIFGDGGDRWIEVSARQGAGGSWTVLGPRQPVTAAPTASVAGRLALPYSDTAGFLEDEDMFRLFAEFPVFGVHTAHFVHAGTTGGWSSAALVAESSTHFGIIASGAPAAAGVAGSAYIDGSTGVRAERGPENKTGQAMFVWDLATGNDAYFGTPTHSGRFLGDVDFFAEVQINGEEIDATEILDEPGLAHVVQSSFIQVPTELGAMVSRSITVPGPGYVIAIGDADVEQAHTSGTSSLVRAGVSDMSDALPFEATFIRKPPGAATGSYNTPFCESGVFQVPSAGTYTFYVVAQLSSGASGSAQFYDTNLTLLYVPTAYGAADPEFAGRSAPMPRHLQPKRGPLSAAEIKAERRAELARHVAALDAKQRELEVLLVEIEALRRDLTPAQADHEGGE